jgi:diacylglycerol kinase family enzyme
MRVLSLTASSRPRPRAPVPEQPRVAVVVNARMREVTERLLRLLSHVVPEEDLFLTTSSQEGARVARLVLERGHDTVFLGGGDCTFARFVTTLLQLPRPPEARLPRLGVLKLGGGQALTTLVKASGLRGEGLLDDVLRARAGEVPGYRPLDLLRVEGHYTPSVGVGLEAQLLHDAAWVRERLGRGPLRGLMEGRGGRASALALRSLPHLVGAGEVECEVYNGASEALTLGADGQAEGMVTPGALLFRGRASLVAAACVPFHASGRRLFSQAGRSRGRMHLKLAPGAGLPGLSQLAGALLGLPAARKGLEVLTSEVTLRFSRPMPLQMAGGPAGTREALHLEVVPAAVELCDFTRAVH